MFCWLYAYLLKTFVQSVPTKRGRYSGPMLDQHCLHLLAWAIKENIKTSAIQFNVLQNIHDSKIYMV